MQAPAFVYKEPNVLVISNLSHYTYIIDIVMAYEAITVGLDDNLSIIVS